MRYVKAETEKCLKQEQKNDLFIVHLLLISTYQKWEMYKGVDHNTTEKKYDIICWCMMIV